MSVLLNEGFKGMFAAFETFYLGVDNGPESPIPLNEGIYLKSLRASYHDLCYIFLN